MNISVLHADRRCHSWALYGFRARVAVYNAYTSGQARLPGTTLGPWLLVQTVQRQRLSTKASNRLTHMPRAREVPWEAESGRGAFLVLCSGLAWQP